MRILFGILFILTSIGGCSSSSLTVREENSIPTNKLTEAYTFVQECVAVGGVEEGLVPNAEYASSEEEMLYRAEACMDDMFILYGEAVYAILENDGNGKRRTIYTSANIVDINKFLAL